MSTHAFTEIQGLLGVQLIRARLAHALLLGALRDSNFEQRLEFVHR